jgi:hypothetical protein
MKDRTVMWVGIILGLGAGSSEGIYTGKQSACSL